MSKILAFFLGSILLAGVWFAVFGGEYVLPGLDRASEEIHCRDYLQACRPNELRLLDFIGGSEVRKGKLNLSSGELTGESAPIVTFYTMFWGRGYGIFHTVNFPILPPYSTGELQKIKSEISSLSEPAFVPNSFFRFQIHLAFYQQNRLRVYDYPRGLAKPALSGLFDSLRFSLLDP